MSAETIRRWVEPWLDPVLATYRAEVGGGDPGYHAEISVQDWALLIRLAENYRDRIKQALGLPETDDVDQVAAGTAATLYLHEVGHWKYAPFDADGHERILAGLSMIASGALDEDGIHLLANMFTDILVNGAHAQLNPDARGRMLFQEGWSALMRTALRYTSMPDSAWQAFLRVQQRLVCPRDEDLRKRLGSDRSGTDIERAVDRLLTVFSRSGELVLDRERWERQAAEFAKIMLPLMRRSKRAPGGKISGSGVVSEEKRGAAGRNDSEKEGGNNVENRGVSPRGDLCGDNVFTTRSRKDRAYRRDLIRRAISRAGGPGERVSARCGWAPRNEVLRVLYEDRAEAIVLEAATKEEATSLPVAHLGVQRVEPGQPLEIGEIKWSASRWYPPEGWQWFREVHPLTIPTKGNSPPGLLPDLLFVLDSSGSMAWNHRTDAGAGTYDLALLAFFGTYRWLDQAGLAPFLRFAGINFSSETLATNGWLGSGESDRLLEVLLAYQGGRTVLNPAALATLRAAARDRFWTILITDGEVANAEEVAEELRFSREAGHLVTLLQLGGETRLAHALRRLRCEVCLVRNASDLAGLVLGRARSVWGWSESEGSGRKGW